MAGGLYDGNNPLGASPLIPSPQMPQGGWMGARPPTPPPSAVQRIGGGARSAWAQFRSPSDQRSQLGMAMLGIGQGLLSQQRGEGFAPALARGIGMGTQGYLQQKQRNRSTRFNDYIAGSNLSEGDKALFAGLEPGQIASLMVNREGQQASTAGRLATAEHRDREFGLAEDRHDLSVASQAATAAHRESAASATAADRAARSRRSDEKFEPQRYLTLLNAARAGDMGAFAEFKATGPDFGEAVWDEWEKDPSKVPEKIADWAAATQNMVGTDRGWDYRAALSGGSGTLTEEEQRALLAR